MIVTDQSPLRKCKHASEDASSPPAGPLPPAYPGYQAINETYPSPPPAPPIVTVMHVPREPAGSRFCKAFFVAVLVWILFSIFVRSFVDMVGHRHGSSNDRDDDPQWRWPAPAPIPTQGNEHVVKCVHGDAWTQPQVDFELPLDSDALFLLSRGALATGAVRVEKGSRYRDKVEVSITVHYHSREVLSRASVCLLTRGDRQHGIGIFTPEWRHIPRESDRLIFEIVVRLPSSGGPSVYIPAFETSFSNFRHSVGPLHDAYEFGSLSLSTSNSVVKVESVFAHKAHIKSSNSPIRGIFKANNTLELITSNSYIHADVTLFNADASSAANLVLKTTNGPVSSHINLYSNTSDETGGSFKVSARTTNNALDVTYNAVPLESELHFDGHSTNGPVTAVLHPAFEGSFLVSTTNAPPSVHVDENVEDPAGHGRQRKTHLSSIVRKTIKGNAFWDGKNADKGSVRLSTTNNVARLKL